MLFNSAEFIFVFLPLAIAAHFMLARWSADAAIVWYADKLHFSNEVSYLMLRRIFSDPMPAGWEKFGELRQQAAG